MASSGEAVMRCRRVLQCRARLDLVHVGGVIVAVLVAGNDGGADLHNGRLPLEVRRASGSGPARFFHLLALGLAGLMARRRSILVARIDRLKHWHFLVIAVH